jgi:hypothetical protein
MTDLPSKTSVPASRSRRPLPRVNIGAAVDGLLLQDRLRRHVLGRAKDDVLAGQVRDSINLELLHQTKIEELQC